MFKKYAEDYYRRKLTKQVICTQEGINQCALYEKMKQEGYIPYRRVLEVIDTGIKELDKALRNKYANIVNRCNGKTLDHYGHYNGMEYLTNIEWGEFCNTHKERLTCLWGEYISSGKNLSMAVSIDRMDKKIGYVVNNMKFVTYGFNSWKETIRPIEVITINGDYFYFMSCNEGCRYFGIRERALGEILNRTKYHRKDYEVNYSTIEKVLKNKSTSNLEDYYNCFIKR